MRKTLIFKLLQTLLKQTGNYKKMNKNQIISEQDFYKISGNNCNKVFIGFTYMSGKFCVDLNAIIKPNLELFSRLNVLVNIQNKQRIKKVDSALILIIRIFFST